MTQQIQCICVDDEPLALEVMQALIYAHPNLKLAKTCQNALDAMEWIKNNPTDVVFSDIQMPGVTGIEFAKAIEKNKTLVVFTTAHQEYAAEAYDLEALDYLLKPIAPERFTKTVKKIEEYFDLRRSKESPQESAAIEDGFIFVKSDSKMMKIAYSDIQFIEAFADYVKIWIGEDKRIVTLQTMKNMEKGLPGDKFMRIHRSFIVAIDKISEVQSHTIKIGNKELPLGKNYKDGVIDLVQKSKLSR